MKRLIVAALALSLTLGMATASFAEGYVDEDEEMMTVALDDEFDEDAPAVPVSEPTLSAFDEDDEPYTEERDIES